MFGFVRLNPQNLKSTPVGASQDILISREDIYRHDLGGEPILLLRKGFELTSDELPRFLKSGAQMNQFQYKHSEEPLRPGYQRPAHPSRGRQGLSRGTTNPIEREAPLRGIGQKRVLLVETDQKQIKRLIDCLFICGLKLDRIHPVRVVSNTPWMVEKYRPQILIADYELPGLISGLTLLKAFADLSYVETLILTVPPQTILSTEENEAIADLATRKKIRILEKPVSRFALHRILSDRPNDTPGLTP